MARNVAARIDDELEKCFEELKRHKNMGTSVLIRELIREASLKLPKEESSSEKTLEKVSKKENTLSEAFSFSKLCEQIVLEAFDNLHKKLLA